MKTSTTILTLAVTLLFLLPTTYLTGQELQVSPAKIFFTANPGSSQTKQVHIRNKGKTEQNFIFNLNDWLTDEKGEIKYFDPGTISRSCSNWITISPPLVTLQPNESATINVTVLVPENNNSTKWSILFVQTAVEQTGPDAIDKQVQMGMKIAARIAIPIFQSPNSNTLYKASLDGFDESIVEGNRRYTTKAINLGDKVLTCKVFFTFSNLETAEEFTSEPQEFSLLPETTKDLQYTLDKKLPSGQYSVAAILDYGYNDELEGIQMETTID